MTSKRPMVHGNKVQVTIGLDKDQIEAVDKLARLRRQSRPSLIRAAVDLFLAENRSDLDSSCEDRAA